MINAAIMMLTNAAPRSPTYLDSDAFAGGWNAATAPARSVQTMATGRTLPVGSPPDDEFLPVTL